MKLSDLKVGDICMQRDGTLCIVLSNSLSKNGLSLFNRNGCKGYLSDYDDDLTYSYNRDMNNRDIVGVYKASEPNMSSAYTLALSIFQGETVASYSYIKWTWEGNKEVVKVKEMTIADVEKLVGSKVKIVKE